MKVIVELSGGDVNRVTAPEGVEVEVRQYHQDFQGDGKLASEPEWPGLLYTIEWPTRLPRRQK